MKVLAISGALSAASSNRLALDTALRVAPSDVMVSIDCHLGELPLFNPDLESEGPHPTVESFRRAVAAHDALLITCPEYGFSLPGALKNGIDWLIGSGELERKPIATTAITAGDGRGLRGLDALHTTLGAVNARVCGKVPIVASKTDASAEAKVEKALNQLLLDLRSLCQSDVD